MVKPLSSGSNIRLIEFEDSESIPPLGYMGKLISFVMAVILSCANMPVSVLSFL